MSEKIKQRRGGEMRYPEVGENGGRKTTSVQGNKNILLLFLEDWDEDKKEEDERQRPDKFQKISQMVFHNRILDSHPV